MSDSLVACPLDSRRGVTEVCIKRIAVTFTVLALLGHLNSLRQVKSRMSLVMSIFLTLANPIYPICQLFFDIIWASLKARHDPRPDTHSRVNLSPTHYTRSVDDVTRSPVYYALAAIGVHAVDEEVVRAGLGIMSRDGYMRYLSGSRLLLHLPPHRVWVDGVDTQASRSGATVQTGRLVVILVATVQCLATMLLGIRRESHDASTFMDRRASMFAASGLVILLQICVCQLLSRPYGFHVGPLGNGYVWTRAVEGVHYVLSLFLACHYAGNEEMKSGAIFAAYHLLGCIIFLLFGYRIPFRSYLLSRYGLRRLLLIICFILASLCGAAWYLKTVYYNPSSDHFTNALGQPVPTDVPCPTLWKDPLADTLWAF